MLGGLVGAAALTSQLGKPEVAGASPPPSQTGGLVLDVRNFGAVGDGRVDDTNSVQTALRTAPEGSIVWIPTGSYLVSRTLTVSKNRIRIDGVGTLTANLVDNPILRLVNVRDCSIGSGLFFDGQWNRNVTAVQLVGSMLGDYKVRADRVTIGVDVTATQHAGATQNSALNELDVVIYNSIVGIRFSGDEHHVSSDNLIRQLVWWGVGSKPSVGSDFVAHCDNNVTEHSYLYLNNSASVGISVNSSAPSHDVGVYENHGSWIVESSTGGVAVRGNRTSGSLGQWTTFMKLRLSGPKPPRLQIAPSCDIALRDTNLGRGGPILGSGEPASVWIGASAMATTDDRKLVVAHDRYPAVPAPPATRSNLVYASAIPDGWHRFSSYLSWIGPKVQPKGQEVQLASSLSFHDGHHSAANVTAPGPAPTTVSEIPLHSNIAAGGPVAFGSISVHPTRSAGGEVFLLGMRLVRTL